MILKKIKNRATGWRPLVLHWRRRRVLRPILQKDRVSSSVSLSYFPQIHFHFTTHVSNQYQRLAVQTTVKRDRVLFESRWATRMNTNLSSRSLHVTRPLRINHTNTHLSKYNTLLFASPIPKQIHHRHTSASFTSVFPTRLNTSREESTKIFKTDSVIREQRSQILSFRSASRETLIKQAQVYFDRGEELVWRRAEPRTTASEDAPVSGNLDTSYRQQVRTPTVETHVQSAPATSTQTTPQQPKLDPGLLDRLTDDVIRRVEKRALIERQRRGL